ncbi:MAG: leucine-rich repeat domain-containing protein [Bacteroidia bacterium]|nr:leucine-rich repeat domain-containing protein [Bacteroidia bacterium]MDW8235736.1 leucine-rich repeat domain-containing protein [Bacteroidia bacterium]MDW8417614.1 leucine-rich repeat domain-containing protein [Bacteroidia bacterium]
MWGRAKVVFLWVSLLLAQEDPAGKLVMYEEPLDRFFKIDTWALSEQVLSSDTVKYLRVSTKVPNLVSFPKLQALYLYDVENLNLPQLVERIQKHCPQLRILGLEDCDVRSIQPLLQLPLEGLLLDGNPIQDFTPLLKLTSLQFLSLGRCNLKDISFLEQMTQLQGLDLSENPMENLRPISSMLQMRVLSLYRCQQIQDFSPILTFRQLDYLNISHTNFAAVRPILYQIDRFPALKVLIAQGIIQEPAILIVVAQLRQLEELTIGQSAGITDLSFVKLMRKLLYLDVHHCQVKELTPLAGMPNLIKLSVGKNQVSSLSPLTKCPRLAYLYCYDNPIIDWEKLLEIPSLKYVMLSKRDIEPERLSSLRAQLRRKGVHVDAP